MSALGRCNNGLGGIMHSPLARALRHLDRYCIILVRTLKHVSPAKCVITITYCTNTSARSMTYCTASLLRPACCYAPPPPPPPPFLGELPI